MTGKRKKYIVQQGFQSKLILKFVTIVSVVILLTTVVTAVFYNYYSKNEIGRFFYITDQPGTDPVIMDRTKIILPALLTSTVLGILLTCIFGIFYSNKLAGPIYRIQNTINMLITGTKVEPIILRKNDEFKELAEIVNKLIVKMQ